MTEQEYYSKLKTKSGRSDIVKALRDIVRSEGWSILMINLQKEYDSEDWRLHDIVQELSKEELDKIRARLYYIKTVMEEPITLADSIANVEESPSTGDVYD